MFEDAVGVRDGTLVVILAIGMVTGIATFAELLGTVTETTVPDETVKLPPVGGAEVMLLDGPGTLADAKGILVEIIMVVLAEGVICVKVPDLGVELAGAVEFADGGGTNAEVEILALPLGDGMGKASEASPS